MKRTLIIAAAAALLAVPGSGLSAQSLFPEATGVTGVTFRQYDYESGFGVDYVPDIAARTNGRAESRL